jgi:NAD(P)H-dependent FMN reductase
MTMKVLVVVGGLSRNSLNRKLCLAAEQLAPDDFTFEEFNIANLPFFNQDLEEALPEMVVEFKQKLKECDAVLIVTPEYNHSIPAVIKNAIDWGSRPYGLNLWEHKIIALMGASIGNIGTYGAQQHLRAILSYLNAYTMEQPEFYLNGSKVFDNEGHLIDEKTSEKIKSFWQHFENWVYQFKDLEKLENNHKHREDSARL